MSKRAQKALRSEELTVLDDRGYCMGEEIRQCRLADIKALALKTFTSNRKAAGLFDKEDLQSGHYVGKPRGSDLAEFHCYQLNVNG